MNEIVEGAVSRQRSELYFANRVADAFRWSLLRCGSRGLHVLEESVMSIAHEARGNGGFCEPGVGATPPVPLSIAPLGNAIHFPRSGTFPQRLSLEVLDGAPA